MQTKLDEAADLAALWKQEYKQAGIPSSFRSDPSSVVSEFFNKHLETKKRAAGPGNVADLGCGRGRNSLFFAEKGFAVTALDIVPENIEQVQKYASENNLNVTAICGDITAPLPFPDKSLDIIIDVFCYKHQTDDAKREYYRQELCRVLKDDGHYLLSLAGKDDGYYGELRETPDSNKIVDPHTDVGSVLFDPEDIRREFKDYRFEQIQTLQKYGLMHGKTYWRVTHAFIMQKALAEDSLPVGNINIVR